MTKIYSSITVKKDYLPYFYCLSMYWEVVLLSLLLI